MNPPNLDASILKPLYVPGCLEVRAPVPEMSTPVVPEVGPKPPVPVEAESRFSLFAIWLAVRKNWLIVVVVTCVVSFAVTFYTLGQTKIYEAEATLLFDPQPPRPLGTQVQAVVDVGGEYWNNKEYYKTQIWIIQSQRVAVQVVNELSLHKSRSFIENQPNLPGGPRLEVSPDEAAKILRSRLSVESLRDSRLAIVRLRDADNVRAQRVLAALVDTYARNNLDDAQDAMNAAAEWLGSQTGALKQQLEANEMALHDYKKDKNILSVSMDDQSNMLRGEMQQLSNALTSVETRLQEISARRSEIDKINLTDPDSVPATPLLNGPLLQDLRGQYLEAASARAVLVAAGKGTMHPEVLAAQAKMDAAGAALMAEVRSVQRSVEQEHAVALREANGLRGLLANAKQRALDLNLLEIEFNRLRRSKENTEKLFGVVTERSKENDLTRMLRINNIRVADRPQVPRRPISPNVPLNVGTGLAVALVLGLLGALGREQLDRSVKTPEDVERVLGLPFLGLLPAVADGRPTHNPQGKRRSRRQAKESEPLIGNPELVVHEQPTSGVAEAARALRTNILFMSPDTQFRTLLVTSAAPSEGKTTVACCIAIAMAQAGRRVALLDCDMRRPRVHRVFGMSNDLGVTTALIDPDSLPDIIRATKVPNLSVVTTGPIPPNPAEILHSDAFHRLLSGLSSQFDHVVVDSPPVAPVTDAAILSTRVDATILVLRAFKTSKDLARRAVRSLRDVGNHRVGTVLNAVDFDRRDYGYYQYYYYHREGYSASEVPTKLESTRDAPPPLS